MSEWRDEIYHYGIKGMKWGIRRTPEELGHYTSSKRPYRSTPKHILGKSAATKMDLASSMFGRKLSLSEVRPKNRDSSATHLKKGEKVQHISGVPFESIRDGQIYVTTTDYDNAMYKAFLGSRLKKNGWEPRVVELYLKHDIKAPSSKEQYAIFKDFLKTNRTQIEKDINSWYEAKGKSERAKSKTEEIYDQFINSVERKSSSQKLFYDVLKQNGYNAVLDEHDVSGSWMLSQKPLIIMDGLSTIGKFTVKDLSMKEAEHALDDWLKM